MVRWVYTHVQEETDKQCCDTSTEKKYETKASFALAKYLFWYHLCIKLKQQTKYIIEYLSNMICKV